MLQGCRAYLFRIEPASQSLLLLSLIASWHMLLRTKSEVHLLAWRAQDRNCYFKITQGCYRISVHINLYRQLPLWLRYFYVSRPVQVSKHYQAIVKSNQRSKGKPELFAR
jgi:hypothetical protein